ncbi:MAG: WecB/TagA/CpsF family glycosyltransferase [Flavobacteriaceae bacterium]|nr:WecB/TagA/CpsF family glycosyltransferase [Flavobacteriaceae bacterium]
MGTKLDFDFLDYKINSHLEITKLVDGVVINTLNPHSFVVARKDIVFKNALISSDFLIPDGIGIVWGINMLHSIRINRISGFDLFKELMIEADKNGKKCFFLGSSEIVLREIRTRCSIEFPNVEVGTLSPPFKEFFNDEDNLEMINTINDFNPNYLFVGMTAPKQEKWLFENRSKLKFDAAASIGAVFDFYAGTVKRPSQFWINLGLEWFPRFLKEPRRLWRRNFISTPIFIYEVFKAKYISR